MAKKRNAWENNKNCVHLNPPQRTTGDLPRERQCPIKRVAAIRRNDRLFTRGNQQKSKHRDKNNEVYRKQDIAAGSYQSGCSGEGLSLIHIYKPKTRQEERPCLIYIHGGGFFGGDTLTVENQCKRFAELADAVVISIDLSLIHI